MGKEQNNKGFSLVEMIIVLAIMVILFVGAGAMMINWRSWNVSDCIEKIDTALGSAKIECMSKQSSLLHIWKESGNYYLKIGDGEEKKIGDEEVQIFYEDGSKEIEITDTEGLKLDFDRKDGSYKQIRTASDGTAVYCTKITVKRKDKSMYIELERKTGKHSVRK